MMTNKFPFKLAAGHGVAVPPAFGETGVDYG